MKRKFLQPPLIITAIISSRERNHLFRFELWFVKLCLYSAILCAIRDKVTHRDYAGNFHFTSICSPFSCESNKNVKHSPFIPINNTSSSRNLIQDTPVQVRLTAQAFTKGHRMLDLHFLFLVVFEGGEKNSSALKSKDNHGLSSNIRDRKLRLINFACLWKAAQNFCLKHFKQV